ncbi:MAG TPA: hypothetical protein VGO58_11910 [Chitinophagaceae bacterium]|jgi:antitoxin component YwqK of YwqJK toxin-antitoxin module|nr:hypothetical protein [Chitinophagaceae bacterium]
MRYLFWVFILWACSCTSRAKQNTSTTTTGPAQQGVIITKEATAIAHKVPARTCSCSQIRDRYERGLSLSYVDGEDSLYSGKCTEKYENGNSVERQYLAGHLLAFIESRSAGSIVDEMHYDTTGNMIKRVRYHPNGQKAYVRVDGDHTYETFYENGRLECKGGYGFTEKDRNDRFYDLETRRLYDSIWKKDGSFDYVRRYSKGGIIY